MRSDTGRSTSPIRYLTAAGQRALAVIGVFSLLKAVGLVLIAEGVARGITEAMAGGDGWQRAIWLGLAGAVLRAISSWAIDAVAALAAGDAKRDLRQRLLARVLIGGGRDLESRPGETAAFATVGLETLDSWYGTYLPALVSSVTLPVIVLIRIAMADWISALVIVLTLPLIPVFMVLIGKETQGAVEQAATGLGALSHHLVELARGLPVLVGLGRSEEQVHTLRDIADDYRQKTMRTLRVAFMSSLALELIATISVAIVAVFIGVRLVNGSFDLQTGLLVLVLAPECYLPLRAVGAAHHASEDGVEAMRRAEALVSVPLSRLPLASSAEDLPGEVRVSGLGVRYAGRSQPVFDGLSFEVPVGRSVLIEGESGSGKSTMLHVLAGLLGSAEVPSGTEVLGSISGIQDSSLAYAPQHPVTYADTVFAEVQLHAPSLSEDEVQSVLERVGASTLSARHPAELSPGELRRVGLARAVARVEAGATVLMLDEPTAHLDPEHASYVVALVSSLRGRVTMVLASHDARVKALADSVVQVGTGVYADSTGEAPSDIAANSVEDLHDIARPTTAAPERAGSLQQLWALVRPYRWAMLWAALLGSAASLFGVALVSASGWLIVRASEQPPILMLLPAIVGVRFFGVGKAGLRYWERLRLHDVVFRMMSDLRVQVWQHLAAQGPAMARELRGERVFDHLIGDVDRMRDAVPRVVLPPLAALLTAVAASIGLGILLPAAGVAVAVGSVVALGGGVLAMQLADQASAKAQVEAQSRLGQRLVAALFAAADLRVHGVEKHVLSEVEELDATATRASRRGAWASGIGNGLVVLTCAGVSMVLVWLSADAVADGRISAAVVAVLVLTPLALIEPYSDAVVAMQRWPGLRAALGRFPAAGGEVEEEAVGGELLEPVTRVETRELSARWPSVTVPVLQGVTTSVARGEWMAVTGPSGVGKSTFLSVLMAVLRPESGCYALDGTDTRELGRRSIRRHLAWCPQDAHLFDSTLRANLLLARQKTDAPTDDEICHVLHRVGLGDWLATLPDGLATRVGAGGGSLSGGQRQRVAIARTLLTRSGVLLLDEPTAHLDRTGAAQMMGDLRDGLTERAVVLVTHHAEDLRAEDRRLELGKR